MTKRDANLDQHLTIACGQCIGCKLERSRQWAIRCVHENQMHAKSCFITLTYNDDNIPFGGTLHRPDFQKFMKRLIKKNGPTRLFYCGEYGDTTRRPHYHALLFGYCPDDPEMFSNNNNNPLFESPTLTKTWGLGHATFGDVTFDTAAYVARYVTKKISGEAAEKHYETVDPETGEIYTLVPEFNGMSRRPGIGLPWLQKYGHDAYSKDEIILRDQAMKPPRAYDLEYEKIDPQSWKTVNRKRKLSNNPYEILNNKRSLKYGKKLISERQLKDGEVIQIRKLQERDIK